MKRKSVCIRIGLACSLLTVAACDKSERQLERRAQQEQEQERANGQLVQSPPQAWAATPRPSVLPTRELYAGGAVSHQFSLALPRNWASPAQGTMNFDEAQVERFVVRLPSGSQQSIPYSATRKDGALTYRYPEQGTMLASMCAFGSTQEKGSAPLYCLKRVYHVGSGQARVASSTSRLGDEAELRPLVAPERVVAGSDLPVMAYLGGQRARGVMVHAFAPDGDVVSVKTGPGGVADVRIDQFGDWKIRVTGEVNGRAQVAELEFSNEVGGRL